MGLKHDLLRQADEELTALKAAIAGLDGDTARRPCLGSWGVREVLIHISGWQREMIPALERLARGERALPEGASYDDMDGWNARFVAARSGVGLAEVLRELDAAHRDFVRAAAAVPETRFAPGKTAVRIVDLNGPHHYREHREQIDAWRRRAAL